MRLKRPNLLGHRLSTDYSSSGLPLGAASSSYRPSSPASATRLKEREGKKSQDRYVEPSYRMTLLMDTYCAISLCIQSRQLGAIAKRHSGSALRFNQPEDAMSFQQLRHTYFLTSTRLLPGMHASAKRMPARRRQTHYYSYRSPLLLLLLYFEDVLVVFMPPIARCSRGTDRMLCDNHT